MPPANAIMAPISAARRISILGFILCPNPVHALAPTSSRFELRLLHRLRRSEFTFDLLRIKPLALANKVTRLAGNADGARITIKPQLGIVEQAHGDGGSDLALAVLDVLDLEPSIFATPDGGKHSAGHSQARIGVVDPDADLVFESLASLAVDGRIGRIAAVVPRVGGAAGHLVGTASSNADEIKLLRTGNRGCSNQQRDRQNFKEYPHEGPLRQISVNYGAPTGMQHSRSAPSQHVVRDRIARRGVPPVWIEGLPRLDAGRALGRRSGR